MNKLLRRSLWITIAAHVAILLNVDLIFAQAKSTTVLLYTSVPQALATQFADAFMLTLGRDLVKLDAITALLAILAQALVVDFLAHS